jgi:hypothetical protein
LAAAPWVKAKLLLAVQLIPAEPASLRLPAAATTSMNRHHARLPCLQMRKMVIGAVLATDMVHHFPMVSQRGWRHCLHSKAAISLPCFCCCPHVSRGWHAATAAHQLLQGTAQHMLTPPKLAASLLQVSRLEVFYELHASNIQGHHRALRQGASR